MCTIEQLSTSCRSQCSSLVPKDCYDEEVSHESQFSTTPSGKKRSLQLQAVYKKFPPGSVRWTQWIDQLQLIGVCKERSATLLATSPLLLQCAADARSQRFKHIDLLIRAKTDLSCKDVLSMLYKHPMIAAANVQSVAEAISWFRYDLKLSRADLGMIFLRNPSVSAFRAISLQQRLKIFHNLGMSTSQVKACWLRSPNLIKVSPHSLQTRFAVIQVLFGYNATTVLDQVPTALLRPTAMFQQRLLFVQHFGHMNPTLPEIDSCSSPTEFAKKKVRKHLTDCGKSLPKLCQQLHQLSGMAPIFKTLKLNPMTMTEVQYFQAFVKGLLSQNV